MRYNGLIRVVSENRRYNRVPFALGVRYTNGPGHRGTAVCTDIGLGGLGFELGRYLRPGTLLLVSIPERPDEEPVEVKARVAWCRGTDEHNFVAGLQVFHDGPEAAHAMTRLSTWAALETGDEPRLWSEPTPKVVLGY